MTSFKFAALFAVFLALSFAQSAADYCAVERADGEACYQDCCEMLGYGWAGTGCDVPANEQPYVSAQCGYCTDSYVACVASYESGQAGGYPASGYPDSGAGCCASAILLSALGLACLRTAG